MLKYIDAEKFEHEWADHFDSMYGEDCAKMFKKALNEFSTEDVAPVIHAHWMHNSGEENIYCSNCGYDGLMDNYCSHCGAKMDEE